MVADIYCDECGRVDIKIHRRYRGARYCGTCYARIFIKRQCLSCFRLVRIPKDVSHAVCQSCETQRPCIRCHISGKPFGKHTPYGTVCASCAPYFRSKAPCEICGRLSSRLTKVKRVGDGLRRCERCASAGNGTCEVCRRYRVLDDHDGRKICKLCHLNIHKLCENCGETMPAGRGKQCESCYWMMLLKRRTLLNSALLSNQLLQIAFLDFSQWLGLRSGFQKASLVIARHALFFRKVDSFWGIFPDYLELLKMLGADYLRRHGKVLEWLQEKQGLVIDGRLKKDMIEECRIQKMLSGILRPSKTFSVICRYETFLRNRLSEDRISILTFRLSLTPAIALMRICELDGSDFPNTAQIQQYLNTSPGQKSSLSGFISFLRKEYRLEIYLPYNTESIKFRRKYLEKELATLANKKWDDFEYLHWCQYALELFHGLHFSIGEITKLQKNKSVDCRGITIVVNGSRLLIPMPSAYGEFKG